MRYVIQFILSLYSLSIFAGVDRNLDLTIPVQPAVYIPEKEFFFNWGDYNEPPTKSQIITFWVLQGLDVYTTHQGLKKCTSCKELNPLLPEQPELSELLLHKAIVAGFLANHSSKKQLTLLNGVMAVAVIHNYELYN